MTFSEMLSVNQIKNTTPLLIEKYTSYESEVIFTGGYDFSLKGKNGIIHTVEKNSIFLITKNSYFDITITGDGSTYNIKTLTIPEKYILQLTAMTTVTGIAQKTAEQRFIKRRIADAELDTFYSAIKKISDKTRNNTVSVFEISYILSFFHDDEKIIHVLGSCQHETTADTVIALMEKNIAHNWKIGEISDKLFITESCLRKKLQKENLSFRKISLDIKMKHASQMLKRTNKHIGYIARNLGFNSTSYFIKVFKDYYNTTPKQYTKNSRL